MAVVSGLLLLALTACGGPTPGSPTSTSGQAPATTPTSSAPAASAPTTQSGAPSGDLFADMPVYSGAKVIPGTQFSFAAPGGGGQNQRTEWRTYKTGGKSADVASFYQAEMPKRGWQQTMWASAEEVTWGVFTKNNGQSWAWVWISGKAGEEFDLALGRGEGS